MRRILVLTFFLIVTFSAGQAHNFKVTSKPLGDCKVLLISTDQLHASPEKLRTYNLYTCTNCGAKDRMAKPENPDGDRRCEGCAAPFTAKETKGTEYASSKLFPGFIYEKQLVNEDGHDAKKHLGKGRDWVCPHCQSRNYAQATSCVSCSHARPEEAHRSETPPPEQNASFWQKHGGKVAVGVAAVAGGLAFALSTTDVDAELTETSWERNATIKQLRELADSGWKDKAPNDAYDFRNCETRSRQASRSGGFWLPEFRSLDKKLLAKISPRYFLADNGDGTSSWGGGGTSGSGGGGDSIKFEAPPVKYEPAEWCEYSIKRWVPYTTLLSSNKNPETLDHIHYDQEVDSYEGRSDFLVIRESKNTRTFTYRNKNGKTKTISTSVDSADELLSKPLGAKAKLKIRRIGIVAGDPEWQQ